MSDNRPASPVSPLKASDGPPESPTTARPLDFDSDQEGGTATPTGPKAENAPKPPPKDEAPPPKPPRPVSAREQAETTLREAFPDIEPGVVKAVLTASGGQVEPAFNALLGMSDPDAVREPDPPSMPPRPPREAPPPQGQMSQMDADEMYARQLQEHYSNAQPRRSGSGAGAGPYNEHLQGSRQGRPGANPNPEDITWRSFIDDDLPEIRDNIRQGFVETQKTVNSWITNFRKNFDGDEDEQDFNRQPARPGQTYGQPYPNRRSGEARRSADIQRYDADPQVIGDDFSKLELRDGEAPPRTSSRPLANPNLFRSDGQPRKSPTGSGRKVSFQDGPPEEIGDMYSGNDKSASTTVQAQTSGKSSKWQPMSQVEPSSVDNDPFSLGDSDDEKDAKPITLKDDEDDERVKKATSEAMGDDLGVKKDEAKK